MPILIFVTLMDDALNRQNTVSKIKSLIVLFSILFFSFLLFSEILTNDFTNWDDDGLIYKNKYVTQFPVKGFHIFCTPEILIRDPLTLLSHAFTYYFFRNNPLPYHFINILLHLCNIAFVFFFVKLLTARVKTAGIVAFLFAVHPFKVESVAWAAERKDVLYTFFFLLGLISYVYYIRTNYKIKYLVLSFFFACFSCLSKTAAVTFPIVLLLIDYYYSRKFNLKNILEKSPIFIVMIIIGYLQISPQFLYKYNIEYISDYKVDQYVNYFNYILIDKFFFLSNSLVFYLKGFFAPYNLCLIHPFPMKVSGYLPFIYYASSFIIIVLIALFILFLKKRTLFKKDIVFGILFFIITISLVLHILPIKGVSFVAERYTYLGYLGLFFISGQYLTYISEYKIIPKIKFIIWGLFGIYLFSIILTTWNRTKVWKDSITLFSDVIKKDHYIAFAYNNRGNARAKIGDYKGAVSDLNIALGLIHGNPDPWYNRGCIYMQMKDYKSAISDFNKTLEIYPRYIKALINRGIAKAQSLDYKGAIKDFDFILKYDPKSKIAFYNKGQLHLFQNNYEPAYTDFTKVIEIDPKDYMSYFCRATATNDYVKAIKDYSVAINLYPEFAEAYYNRGISKKELKDYIGALNDMNKAIEIKVSTISKTAFSKDDLRISLQKDILDFTNNENKAYAYYNKGRINLLLGNKLNAIKDFDASINFNKVNYDTYLYRGNAKLESNDLTGAIADYKKVIELNPKKSEAFFGLGNASYLMKDYNEALKDYNKAIDLSEEPNAKLYSNRGNVNFSLKNYKEALTDYCKAIDLEKNNADYYFNRGIVKYNLKDQTAACNDFKKAKELGMAKADEALQKYCK